jgi:SPP1 family predicted phage head-tail adaptor
MLSGKLRYQVIIQQQVTARTSSGATQNTFAEVSTVRAGFTPMTGRELLSAQKLNAEITTQISIRYQGQILPDMRIFWADTRSGRNRVFEVLAIMDKEERHHEMTVLCKELNLPGGTAEVSSGIALPAGFSRKNFNEAVDGNRTVFTLPTAPDPNVLQVYIGGEQLLPGQGYTLVGNQVTFAVAPLADDQIWSFY